MGGGSIMPFDTIIRPPKNKAKSRIGQRGVLPLTTKWRLVEFYNPKTNSIEFKASDGTIILSASLDTGAITFGSAITFSGALTINDNMTVVGDFTLTGGFTLTGNFTLTGDLAITGDINSDGDINCIGMVTHSGLNQSFSANVCTGGTPSASHEDQPGQGSDEAFDGDPITKWLAELTSTPWLQYQLAAAKTVVKYDIIAGDDNQDRDPKSWIFQGSNNGVDFVTLDTQTDFWFGPRSIRKEFYFNNSTAYTYYRLTFTANWGSGDSQLAELEMFEKP